MDRSNINRQKFCRYKWYNLFQNSSIEKDYGGENLVIRKINRYIDKEIILLVIDTIFSENVRVKK